MSKRDEMRKLREKRMKQLSEVDRSTPAEEAAQRAEEATTESKARVNDSTPKTINGRYAEIQDTDIKHKHNFSDQTESTKHTDVQAKNTDDQAADTKESTIVKEETTSTPKEVDNTSEKETEQEKNGGLNDGTTRIGSGKEAILGESTNIRRLDFNYKAKDQKCGLTHVSLRLTDESMELLKTRSLQMGMTLQDYYNMLIEEDRYVVDQATGDLTPDKNLLGKINLHGKKSKNIAITVDNYKFMKKAAALRAISPTEYSNYIILKEHQREETEGRRPGKYD